MSASNGTIDEMPVLEINDVPLPLVEEADLQRMPLSPFSPATQAGNTSRITDARLAAQVWDNFTGGMGQRDEEGTDSTSFSVGNLDARVASNVSLPPLPTLLGNLSAYVGTTAQVYVELIRNSATTVLLFWSPAAFGAYTLREGVAYTVTTQTPNGFAAFNGAYFLVAWDGTNSLVLRSTDGGVSWTTAATLAYRLRGLVFHDNRLISYDVTGSRFVESLDGVTWTLHSVGPKLLPGEEVSQLVVWVAPSQARMTVLTITNLRILGYEEESGDWHTFYDFEGIFQARWPVAYMYRRDSNLYFAPYDAVSATNRDENALVMMFTPGTSDEVGPGKRFGLSPDLVEGVFKLQGGVHWLYAFAQGQPGGIFALNEFQGWTSMFDPKTVGDGLGKVVGGGYANGRLWALLDNGNVYEMLAPDRRELPPLRAGGTYNLGTHYLRSSWSSHNQRNRWKIGAYFEIDMRLKDGTSGVPTGARTYFLYRTDSGNWIEIPLGESPENTQVGTLLMQSVVPNTQEWPLRVPLPNGTTQDGLPYKQIQWEVRMERSSPAESTPVLASVTLYYIFWQEPEFAYQFNVDLSWETWSKYPDQTLGGYSRDELIEYLLGLPNIKGFHRVRYASGSTEVYIPATDILVAGREDPVMGGGIYSTTVRDLSMSS